VEVSRQQKLQQEEQDQEQDEFNAAKGESMTINQQVFSPGDYVYVQMPENKIPSICCIERLWTSPTNEKLMQASIFVRPHETYHVTTRKFLEKDSNTHDSLPDVPLAVQELFLTLFTTLYNHQDEEGRCYSDSLAELPEYDEIGEGPKVRGISLDLVKRRLDKGAYKRLDIYQEDIFACLERARKLSRTDSDIFQVGSRIIFCK